MNFVLQYLYKVWVTVAIEKYPNISYKIICKVQVKGRYRLQCMYMDVVATV